MKTIKCELCGSTSVTKVDSIYQCDYCKTKYSIEEAKKLITDMRVVGIEEYANYLTLARKAKEEENVENAEKYYGMVLRIDSNNWEAKFYNSYYAAIRTTLFDIENSIQSLSRESIFEGNARQQVVCSPHPASREKFGGCPPAPTLITGGRRAADPLSS